MLFVRKKIAGVFLALVTASLLGAQTPKALEGFSFVNQDVGEILYAVSLYSGIPIVADDTVSGKMNFRFAGQDFENAFDSFLMSQRLYVTKSEERWTVSRILIACDEEGLVHLDANDVKAWTLIERLSSFFEQPVTYEPLPDYSVTLHAQGKNIADFVQILVRQLGNAYEFDKENLHIKGRALENRSFSYGSGNQENLNIKKDDVTGTFSADIKNRNAGDVLEHFFALSGKPYVFCCGINSQIQRLVCRDKTEEEMLALICLQTKLSVSERDGITYVESEHEDTYWKQYQLKYAPVSKIQGASQAFCGKVNIVQNEKDKSFLCQTDQEGHKKMEELLSLIDVEIPLHKVELKSITCDRLLANLPPDVSASQVIKTNQDNVFFFNGSDEQYNSLVEKLYVIDVPARRLRYDLLVVQYQSSLDNKWKPSLTVKPSASGTTSLDYGVGLGSVLDLSLDVVGAFGMDFAAKLQWAINENQAKVFADTTLFGLSGGTINFSHLNTFRYRDNNLDPETGKPIYTGITREISSGLKIDVSGWVSGDGMITTKITASVSRQGTDLSASTGNPPPTSEKVITTEVLGKSGAAIVLSGLLQEEETVTEQGVPFLSKIPLLGNLFKSKIKTKEKTEMVIYLVPQWVQEEELECDGNEEEVPVVTGV